MHVDFMGSKLPIVWSQNIFTIEISGIKDPLGDNFINTVSTNFGSIETDGYGITWTGLGAHISAIHVVEINWTQIPTPGGLALLGLAGLAGRRRRR